MAKYSTYVPVRVVEEGGVPVIQVAPDAGVGTPVLPVNEDGTVTGDATRKYSTYLKVTVSPIGFPVIRVDSTGLAISTELGGGTPTPGNISDLTATAQSDTSILLEFTPASNATSHQYRIDGGSPVACANGSQLATGLTAETPYDFEVRGVNGAGNGAWSNVATETTEAEAGISFVSAPTISGTPASGNTLTANSGNIANGSHSGWQWNRDGAPISGATGSTYSYVPATDDGTAITVTQTATDGVSTVSATSNSVVGLYNAIVYDTSFAAPDGTNLNGFEGWVQRTPPAVGSNHVIISNDLWTNSSGSPIYVKDVGSPDHSVSVTYAKNAGGTLTSEVRYIRLNYTDANNFIILQIGSNGSRITARVGGVDNNHTFFGVANNDGDVIELRLVRSGSDKYVQLWKNGSHTSNTSGLNGGLGFPVTSVPDSNFVSIQGSGNKDTLPAYPIKAFYACKVTVPAANSISVLTATENNSAGAGSSTLTLTGTLTGTITQLQVLVIDAATGEVFIDWTNVSGISGSTYSATTPTLPAASNGRQVKVIVRDATNKASAGSLTKQLNVYQTVFPFRFGLNGSGSAYYTKVDPFVDQGRRLSWRLSSSEYSDLPELENGLGGYNYAGEINSYASGKTSIKAMLPWYWSRLGQYTVTYPKGIVLNTANPSIGNAGASLGAEYSIDANTAGRKLTIANHVSSAMEFDFSGTPTGKTSTTMGLRPTIIHDDYAGSSDLVTAESVDTLVDFNVQIYRPMNDRHINNTVDERNLANRRTYAGYHQPIELTVERASRAGCDLWLPFFLNEQDDLAEFECDYVAQHLPAGKKLYVELSNEIWNSQFTQWEAAAYLGLKLGLHVGATSADRVPITGLNSTTGGLENRTVATRGIAVGEKFGDALTGTGTVYECISAISANDAQKPLVTATDANWLVTYNVNRASVSGLQLVSSAFITKRVPIRAISAGETFAFNMYGVGIQVWQANVDIAAWDGAAAPSTTTNSYFTVLLNNGHANTARLRFVSYRTKQLVDIARAAFTAAGRDPDDVIPVIAWQAAASWSSGGQLIFDYDDNYLHFRRFATAPYWGAGVGGINLQSYSAPNYGTWTTTARALYTTDLPACVDAFFGAVNDAIDTAVDAHAALKVSLATYYTAKGLSADHCEIAAYEMNSHCWFNSSSGWSNSTAAAALQAAVRDDPRSVTATNRYLDRYKQKIGGDICWFAQMDPDPWAIHTDELDRTSNIAAGLLAYLNS